MSDRLRSSITENNIQKVCEEILKDRGLDVKDKTNFNDFDRVRSSDSNQVIEHNKN